MKSIFKTTVKNVEATVFHTIHKMYITVVKIITHHIQKDSIQANSSNVLKLIFFC